MKETAVTNYHWPLDPNHASLNSTKYASHTGMHASHKCLLKQDLQTTEPRAQPLRTTKNLGKVKSCGLHPSCHNLAMMQGFTEAQEWTAGTHGPAAKRSMSPPAEKDYGVAWLKSRMHHQCPRSLSLNSQLCCHGSTEVPTSYCSQAPLLGVHPRP